MYSYVCIHTYIHICIYTYRYLAHIYIYMYVYMYTYIHTYLHENLLQKRQSSEALHLRPLGHKIVAHVEHFQVEHCLDSRHFFNQIVRNPQLFQRLSHVI